MLSQSNNALNAGSLISAMPLMASPPSSPQGDQLLEHLGRPLPADSVHIRTDVAKLAAQIEAIHGPGHQGHAGVGFDVSASLGSVGTKACTIYRLILTCPIDWPIIICDAL